MFSLDLSPTYWWPVPFKVPAEDGTLVDATFAVQFRRLTSQQIEDKMAAAAKERRSDADLAREVVVGWRDVVNASGVIPFTPEALDRLLSVPGAGGVIMRSLLESVSKGAEKN